mgnify:CR=1 FL=1
MGCARPSLRGAIYRVSVMTVFVPENSVELGLCKQSGSMVEWTGLQPFMQVGRMKCTKFITKT